MKNVKHIRKRLARTQDRPRLARPLPCDADELHASRTHWAAAALGEFRRRTGADLEDAVSDLLADLMHWCDQSGQSFADELRRARRHYEAEAGPGSEMNVRLTRLAVNERREAIPAAAG